MWNLSKVPPTKPRGFIDTLLQWRVLRALEECVPRGVTAAFTAQLGRLTHPGTSVGQWGSPLIHPQWVLRGPNTVRPPDLRQCSFRNYTIPLVFDRWLPKRGTMFHPQPPARGLCQHGVAVGRSFLSRVGNEPPGLVALFECYF